MNKLFWKVFVVITLLVTGVSGASLAVTPPARAAGTAWYVDNAATGANNGTSWTDAWSSFANIAWSSVQPGDTIYISGGNNGKTYQEPLRIGADGAAGAPITIRVGQDPGHNGLVTISNPNDSNTVPFGTGIYVGRNHITIDGNYAGMQRLRVTGCRDAGIYVYYAHHVLVTYLEIDNNGNDENAYSDAGVYALIGTVTEIPFLEVSHCRIHDNWQDQLALSSGAPEQQYGQFLIHHNEIYNLSDDGLEGGSGVDFYNNVLHGLIDGKGRGHPDGIQLLGGHGRIYNNVFYDMYHPTKVANAYIYYELYYDNSPVQECCVRIYNNLIYHTFPAKDPDYLRGITFSTRKNVTSISDAIIANNTLIGLPFGALTVAFANDAGALPAVKDIYVLNNILHNIPTGDVGKSPWGFGPAESTWTAGAYGAGADVTIDYNIVSAGEQGGTYTGFKGNWWSYDTFKANTGCQAHITGNPDPLLDVAYQPTDGSPAVEAGVDLSAYFTTDQAGHARPQGAAWDIGAYEFVPALTLHGAPADRAIRLTWEVNTTLPPTATWRIDYYTQTAAIYTVTDPYSTTRSLVLTEHVQNYRWYTVTLNTVGVTPVLSDTVRVMPTDRFVYLPLVLIGLLTT
ncbi:MAG TPA: right-handed parallel beta-helix repeat-containing protein [Anaerolineae bacterium]|mgnify:CR=1 FL=1|nr:right-handed parallel beta-helix repeat-containing protein [Anaerolineae bacterium]HQH38908.1 right-handed parallel beta-helix repeat-containing protein [Anaerolineae bacterium]